MARTLTSRSLNLTLRFFQTSQEESCGYSTTSDALTFTTKDVPIRGHCFSMAELFGGNSTRGFVNQTKNLGRSWESRRGHPDVGIHWEVRNSESYDPQANYSSILYHQNDGINVNDRGPYAWRTVFLYGSDNCVDVDTSPADEFDNWYGNNCWSEGDGDCRDIYYGVGSFSVQAAPKNDEEAQRETCWAFAENGLAAGLYHPWTAVMSALVGVSVAVWLAL